jgi:hypothetical protein
MTLNVLTGPGVLRAMVASPEVTIRFVIHFFDLSKVVSDNLSGVGGVMFHRCLTPKSVTIRSYMQQK